MKTASTLVAPEIAPDRRVEVKGTSKPPSRGWTAVSQRIAPLLVPAGALALGWWALASAPRPDDVGGLGLIGILPVGAWVALGVLIASFAATAVRGRFTGASAAVHVLALVVLLNGAPALLYQHPRFSTAWLHAGFIEYIQRSGDLLPQIDARFNWPGFFTGAALLGKIAGINDPLSLLGWFPVLINLAYALPIMVIGRMATDDARVRWIGLWLFYLASWVGQDYLSPQAVNLFLYLSVLALVLTYFRPRAAVPTSIPASRLRAWAAMWRRDEIPVATTTAGQRLGLLGVLLAMCLASVVSHQLTPVFLIVALFVLNLFRRSTLRGLPFLLGVAMVAFVSFAAVPFWSGHLDLIFGGFGKLGSSVGANVGDRVRGNSAHQFVVQIRLLVTVAVWLLAGVGLVRRLIRTGIEPALILLATVPVSVVVMQSYGGEAMLRVYAFTLPFMALAVAIGFAPRSWAVKRVVAGTVLLGVVSAVLAVGFYIARFGNERFEFMRAAEVEAMHWVYDHAPRGSIVGAYDAVLPWSFKDVEAHRHLKFPQLAAKPGENITKAAELLRNNKAGGFIILTTSQEANGEENYGLRAGWMKRLRQAMVASGDFEVVYENQDAWVLEVTPAPPPAEITPPAALPAEITPPAPLAEITPAAPPAEVVDPAAPPLEVVDPAAPPAETIPPASEVTPAEPTTEGTALDPPPPSPPSTRKGK